MAQVKSEYYKGFEFRFYLHCVASTQHWNIYKDGDLYSSICLISAKACRNVIDTYLRSQIL